MYKDIISYEIVEGMTESDFLAKMQIVWEEFISQQPGIKGWDIHKNNQDGYTDIVYWESQDHAHKSELAMSNYQNLADWVSCYNPESIKSENITELKSYK